MANYQISSILMEMAKKSEVKQSAYSNRFNQLNSQNGSFSNRCGFFSTLSVFLYKFIKLSLDSFLFDRK